MKIKLNTTIYPLEAILNTSYFFIDRLYLYLDKDSSDKEVVIVNLEGKKKLSAKQLERIKNEFMDELLHNALRYRVSKNNKKIREYIMKYSFFSILSVNPELFASGEKLDYQEDSLGIAVPWEEKYGQK